MGRLRCALFTVTIQMLTHMPTNKTSHTEKLLKSEKDMVAFFHLVSTVPPSVSFYLPPFSRPKIKEHIDMLKRC